MKRIVWLTDIHLNFLPANEVAAFLDQVATARPDAVLVGGDIAESPELSGYLRQLALELPVPIYFVLGNHDYYFGSIAHVRSVVRLLTLEVPNLVWLSEAEPIKLSPQVGLVGHDGWADGRLGDYVRSLVMMNDYRLIEELAGHDKQSRWPLLKGLADEAAAHVRHVLPAALQTYPHVVLLTHLPPLREACWYEGQISDDEWLPHFTCQALGQAILDIMRERPDRTLTVLCGHTHSPGQTQPLPNVTILTGEAHYGHPQIQHVFEF